MPLPLPCRGESLRHRIGRLELVLERGHGSYTLLCHDGEQARSWSLGLREDGQLWLSCRMPRLPIVLALRDMLVLVPGARVRGFVKVPLVPTVSWLGPAAEEPLAELLPPQLAAEWDQESGQCVQRWTSPLLQRLPPPTAEPWALLPLSIRNDSQRVQSPERLPLRLEDRELHVCRGHLLGAARRLRIGDHGRVVTEVRMHPAAAREPGRGLADIVEAIS